MTKKRTNISLDPQVYEEAKDLGINISQMTERALKSRIRSLQENEIFSHPMKNTGLQAEIENNTARSEKLTEPENMDEEEFLEDFEETCKIDWNLAESTTKERMRYAKKLVQHLDGHPLTASKKELRKFISRFKDENATKTVRVIYNKYFDSGIADSFKVQKTPPKPRKIPKKSELRKVYRGLKTPRLQVAFLILATSGLRRRELMELTPSNIEREERGIYPSPKDGQATKRQWVTFYNKEAEEKLLEVFSLQSMVPEERLFDFSPRTLTRNFRKTSRKEETTKITPQVLRVWFCNEMNRLGVSDRYIDAFCGRAPESVLAKFYSDYSPDKLKQVYEEAKIQVLQEKCT